MLNILRFNFQQTLKLIKENYKRYMFKTIDFNDKLISIIEASWAEILVSAGKFDFFRGVFLILLLGVYRWRKF